MSPKISKELSKHRLEQAKEDLEVAQLLYNKRYFKSANNRAYYAIFHAIRSVLALETKDFKRHKTVLAYLMKTMLIKKYFLEQ